MLGVIVCATVSVVFWRYPKSWNNVEVGMSRDEGLIGLGESITGTAYMHKGDVYTYRIPFGWYEMSILTDTLDIIYGKYISLYIGTQKHYRNLNIVSNKK